jgi:hypothetical protein
VEYSPGSWAVQHGNPVFVGALHTWERRHLRHLDLAIGFFRALAFRFIVGMRCTRETDLVVAPDRRVYSVNDTLALPTAEAAPHATLVVPADHRMEYAYALRTPYLWNDLQATLRGWAMCLSTLPPDVLTRNVIQAVAERAQQLLQLETWSLIIGDY